MWKRQKRTGVGRASLSLNVHCLLLFSFSVWFFVLVLFVCFLEIPIWKEVVITGSTRLLHALPVTVPGLCVMTNCSAHAASGQATGKFSPQRHLCPIRNGTAVIILKLLPSPTLCASPAVRDEYTVSALKTQWFTRAACGKVLKKALYMLSIYQEDLACSKLSLDSGNSNKTQKSSPQSYRGTWRGKGTGYIILPKTHTSFLLINLTCFKANELKISTTIPRHSNCFTMPSLTYVLILK